mgnify:CR=1 FL=1
MTPNGRRAWRRFAKQQRRKVNRKNRETGTPWINDADGAFYRHEQRFFEKRPTLPPQPFTTRSLVGMSQSTRKRKARAVAFVVINSVTLFEHAVPLASALHERLYRERGFPRHSEEMMRVSDVRAKYRIGERLRPCPGCFDCAVECWVCHEPHDPPDELCGGSGVIRAGKLLPLLRKPDCGFYID